MMTAQRICLEALRDKYCVAGESEAIDVQRRVARALAAVERDPTRWEPIFLEAQISGVVMGGRINSSAGTSRESTWINCFVQPIADAISHSDEDGRPGIYVALQEATETMRRGGGVGYDFSHLRPRGAYVATTQSEASGPVSYMRVFDRSCETVESAGARRGAQMAVLRIDHPDVLEFVRAKGERGELVNFNMSVAVTDDFMQRAARRWRIRTRARGAAVAATDVTRAFISVPTECGCIGASAPERCGTRSCVPHTTTANPASCSSTASTPTTISITANASKRPIRAPNNRCLPMAAVASAASI